MIETRKGDNRYARLTIRLHKDLRELLKLYGNSVGTPDESIIIRMAVMRFFQEQGACNADGSVNESWPVWQAAHGVKEDDGAAAAA